MFEKYKYNKLNERKTEYINACKKQSWIKYKQNLLQFLLKRDV